MSDMISENIFQMQDN